MERLRSLVARLERLLGPDPTAVVQSLVALAVSLVATLAAGLILASSEDRLAQLPGLLLIVPAAIAQRGNVFGAMGSRLGTAIHTGAFRISTRPDTVFGQNVIAAVGLSFIAATWLAVVAKLVSIAFGVADAMSLLDFLAVSVLGGMVASLFVLAITVGLAAGSTRFGWDLDNVTAPLVTATGDLVTLPALILASTVVGGSPLSELLGIAALVTAGAALFAINRTPFFDLRRIVADSLPVLALASTISLVAGVTVEKQLDEFLDSPALLILVPTYFGMAGALGGILASRLGSKVHLGLVGQDLFPQRVARADIRGVAQLSLPIFVLVGVGAHIGAGLIGVDGPGLVGMVGVSSIAGLGATIVVVIVAYYGTLFSVRSGIDPDTAAIPLTNSTLDLVGAFTLIAAILALGV